MTIEATILKNVEKLPDSVKQAVLLYTEFLVSQYANGKPEEAQEKPKKKRFAGSMKGTFVLPLPDDFDEPLEDFKDYM
ncbi:DUF2281 domain-containing protein [Oscillatoria sp. FACHB-1406]|uniref:type II toxin-antitoxin system VapB family antitoxin n=1 Tax=Oscillatoria sp. FACHB-1406 TaxID=2692846 RepID=UPI0016875669|nr:DUF2281 domain-containing protein [Oscillatoria sp. FACHB-1406]MBD2579311.1 DUF2281 domain-containing protein [Oscillatoria sp. FACHB-1406]